MQLVFFSILQAFYKFSGILDHPHPLFQNIIPFPYRMSMSKLRGGSLFTIFLSNPVYFDTEYEYNGGIFGKRAKN